MKSSSEVITLKQESKLSQTPIQRTSQIRDLIQGQELQNDEEACGVFRRAATQTTPHIQSFTITKSSPAQFDKPTSATKSNEHNRTLLEQEMKELITLDRLFRLLARPNIDREDDFDPSLEA